MIYIIVLCNKAVASLDERKYYCIKHVLILHQEHHKCQNHKHAAIKEIANINNVKEPRSSNMDHDIINDFNNVNSNNKMKDNDSNVIQQHWDCICIIILKHHLRLVSQ